MEVVVGAGGDDSQQWGAGGRGRSGRGAAAKYAGGRTQTAWGRGVCLPYPSPPGGYNYDAYPPNLLRLIGNQPPIHAADPRKRWENCNELGHMHQYCPSRVDPGQLVRAQPRPAGTFTAPHQRPPWAHSYGQANIAAVGEVTDTDYYDYGDCSDDGDYGDYGDYDYESQKVPPQTQSQFQQQPLHCNYAQPSPPPPPQMPAYHGN